MGNIQSVKQKKGLLEEKDAEQTRLNVTDYRTETKGESSTFPYKSNIHEYSSSVDQLSFSSLQPVTSSSKSSACLNVQTAYHKLVSSPSEDICEHTEANHGAKSTSLQTLECNTPPLFTCLLSNCPSGTGQPPTPPTLPCFSVVPKDSHLHLVLPGTVQLLEKADHTLKEIKTPPSNLKGICATMQKPQILSDQVFSLLPQTDLGGIICRSEYVKEQEALSDTEMQSDMRSELNGIPREGTTPKASSGCREGRTKQIARKTFMNKLTCKQPNQSEHIQPFATTSVHSIIPTQILLNKTSTNPMAVEAMKQTGDPASSQNSNDLSIPRLVSYESQETSVAAPAIKSTGTANSPLLPASTMATCKEQKDHQSLKEDYISFPFTNNMGTTAKPPTATTNQCEGQRKCISIIQAVSSSTKRTLVHSPHLSSGRMRIKLKRQSKYKVNKKVIKSKDILPSAHDNNSMEEACKKVEKETRGGAETQTQNCTNCINGGFLAELSTDLSRFGESNLETFSQINHKFSSDIVDAFNKAIQLSATGPPSLSSESSVTQSTALVSQVSEDSTTENVVVFISSTTSKINTERPKQDIEDPSNILTALHHQTERQDDANTKKRILAQAEVIKEIKISDLSPPKFPSRPEGHWHAFTTNLACTHKTRCPHRSNALLPHNLRQWLNLEHNYLCEPSWATTASLAASVAFRMREEKSDFCL